MIRTFVCEKEGCSGNTFLIESDEDRLCLVCSHCHSKYDIDSNNQEYILLPNCCQCNNKVFKVYKDIEKGNVYYKCTKCGEVPEKIYVDPDGIQVSYEAKLLSDIKEIMKLLEQRIYNLEGNIRDLENGQNLLEQSLAYINKYIVEKN
ncbi:hypothetical protein [Caproiciproducens sp. MSJ-32]|uniref:hypothetical protein n=1 Tax=Caproiciproducens sp. MSJ-32 TaxID=2841527 RepID=UPI001C105D46|nr:hypothetical protein [Caproiciproducens sp. MSJ-32]MBU5453817.1 hypothetical protein [Caproiciproducens sp. MSJ-32]